MTEKYAFYSRPLTVTSQFSFCSLPLRLDSYRGCSFGCGYCFAIQRGGNVPDKNIVPADPEALERAFKYAERISARQSLVGQMLNRRVPIHFGGMSDPFQPAERKWGTTRSFLKTLAGRNYPVVISTKGTLVSNPEYVGLLKDIGNVVVQFSFSTLDHVQARRIEPNTAPPSDLLRSMEGLASSGVKVSCRWQPFIKGISGSPQTFVNQIAQVGASHIALEHLKVPTEIRKRALGIEGNAVLESIKNAYKGLGALRDGREYVLPSSKKIDTCLEVRDRAHDAGMTFGAADNEFLPYSDGEACCSGVDKFSGFQNVFRFNVACAVRRGRGGDITYDSISNEWRPEGNVDRYLNSQSRIAHRLGVNGSIEDHVRYRWGTRGVSGGPMSFYGVESTDRISNLGFAVYRFSGTDDSAAN
jgi:DNA repair photolyase